MKKILLMMLTFLQHKKLKANGWRIGNNVAISRQGVRKIGKGKIICSDNVCINAQVLLVAFEDIIIGKNSTLAYRVMITTSSNPNSPFNSLASLYPPMHKSVHIGDNCWIGAGAIILPGITIGNGSVVAAGAVVSKDVPEGVMVAGVPAVVKKHLSPEG